jgi:hypothetical protein
LHVARLRLRELQRRRDGPVSGLLLSAALLGGVLCGEARGLIDRPGGQREILALAETARARARDAGHSLAVELRGAWARPTCPAREARRFEALARRFLKGKIRGPKWSRTALAFCTEGAARRVGARWRARGFERIRGTGTVHVFWRKRTKR